MLKILFAGIGIVVVFFAAVLFYAFRVEPYMLSVNTHPVGEEGAEKVTIVQISDIQISDSYTTGDLKKLVDKVGAQKPDLFLFTGDLYENYAEYGPEEEVIELLSSVEAPLGKYAVWGNRDYGGGCARRYEDIMEQSGITLLTNESRVIETESGKKIYLAGLDDYLLGDQEMGEIGQEPDAEYSYRILMLHEPDLADDYSREGFDLMVAGHSHGGQVRLPFWKGITTSMAKKYTRGFYQLDPDGLLYVNPGIGTSHYPVRFGVVPEITVFELGLQ